MGIGDLTSMFGGGQSSTSTTSGPKYLQEGYQNLAQRATDLSYQPYQGWTGQFVASPSDTTKSAWNLAQSNVGNYQPYLQQASNLTSSAATPLTSSDVSTFLNPYQDYVTKGITQNFKENVLPSIQDKFVSAGQSRSPQEAEITGRATRDLNTSVGQSMAGTYQSALNSALQQKQQQGALGAQMGNLGTTQAQLGSNDVSQLSNAGKSQDTLAQQNLNAQIQEFNNQKSWPYQQLQFLSGIYGGINPTAAGLTTNSSTTSNPATGSILGNMLGNSSLLSTLALKRGGIVRDPAYRSALAAVKG